MRSQTPSAPPGLPTALPAPTSPERWHHLQALRRRADLPLEPWLEAIETGRLAPLPDLMEVLADRLDPAAVLRLLRWWLSHPGGDGLLPERIGRLRHPAVAALLRQALVSDGPADRRRVLLPLLGHQRCVADFPLLSRTALAALPAAVRRAALEGLSVGLSAWPRAGLRRTLRCLVDDLDPAMATAALDALARLPGARADLLSLADRRLDPAVAERLQRRLRSLPATPLLLVVHGRAGGEIPAELQRLAAELSRRRGSPVELRALTDPAPPPPARPPSDLATPLTLVPLLLLPGRHVRADLPALVAELRRCRPVRALPFLGAWPAWQRALAEETNGQERPAVLLHHPVEGRLATRFLHHLGRVCGTGCRPVPVSGPDLSSRVGALGGPVLPLTLASNRLSDALRPWRGEEEAAPLLDRPRLRRMLLELLASVP